MIAFGVRAGVEALLVRARIAVARGFRRSTRELPAGSLADLVRAGRTLPLRGLGEIEAIAAGGAARPWFERWREILDRSPENVASFLVDEGEEARALRQVTPFANVVPPRERWRIWREVRERWDRS